MGATKTSSIVNAEFAVRSRNRIANAARTTNNDAQNQLRADSNTRVLSGRPGALESIPRGLVGPIERGARFGQTGT